MKTKTSLDYISHTGCSVKTESYIEDGGVQYPVGEPTRCAYMNSKSGRAQLKADYPDYFKALELSVWGKTPTVEEEPVENQ